MKESNIEWTDHTWNPASGCPPISRGCAFCYMHRDRARWTGDEKAGFVHKRARPASFKAPLNWHEPARVFTASLTDWFLEEADEWRAEAWEIIKRTPHLTYQILTKRIERVAHCLPPDWGNGYPNVWLGVSVEDQANAEKRIPLLQAIPAQVRFLSCEPLLDPVDLSNLLAGIGWVIVGGESGNDTGKYRFRPCAVTWIFDIVSDCEAAGVPVFVKQLGTYLAKHYKLSDRKGGKWEQWPEGLEGIKRREFPDEPR